MVKKLLLSLVLCLVTFQFSHAEKEIPFFFIPKERKGPFPVAVWLHGYRAYSTEGHFPGHSQEELQKHADLTGAVILGFPATTDLPDSTQVWSEEPVADHAYIQDILESHRDILKLDLSRVILFGFSQGAMVAADLNNNYPESYIGAILMSPGGVGMPKCLKMVKPEHKRQTYFCFCGAEEAEGNVMLTKIYAEHFQDTLGAKVILKLHSGVSEHQRPPDFMENFPKWITAILENAATPVTEVKSPTTGQE